MPLYTFRNNETKEEWEDMMSIAASEKYLKENPHIIIVPPVVSFIDSASLGILKPDDSFRDILREIDKKHKKGGGKINTF